MQIKNYDQPGLLAWSNSKIYSEYFVQASLEEQEGNYRLNLCKLDLEDRSKKVKRVGQAFSPRPFRCLAWDVHGEKQNYPYGLLFGGMENGTYTLWDLSELPSQPLDRSPDNAGLLFQEEDSESFPIMCAEWNSLKNNFLAFGAEDVLILDIGKGISNSEINKPGKKNPHVGSYITSVAWNKEVCHILASASENGLISLWDIKTDTSIFQFKDSGMSVTGNRNVSICWSKKISTQIAVTLDDEKRNELQIWDLRNQKGPIVVIDKHHTGGLHSMDWCETDPELILTASRDSKVLCWNYTQDEEPVSQYVCPTPVREVKWSKKLPSIYAVCGNQTSIMTLDNSSQSYIPNWYRLPLSAVLQNHSLLTYDQNRGRVMHEYNLKPNNTMGNQCKQLRNIMQNKPISSHKHIMQIIKAKQSDIYEYLGYDRNQIVKEVQQYTGKRRERSEVKAKFKSFTNVVGQAATQFFASISQQQNPLQETEEVKQELIPRNSDWDKGRERLIKQNMLIGNYEGAIDAALKCGRTAQALIIAHSVDLNTFKETLKTFFTQTTDNFITDILKHIAQKDTTELINKYDLTKWKECVALIYSLNGSTNRAVHLKALAARLPFANDKVLCYILAEDFSSIVELYAQEIAPLKGSIRKNTVIVCCSKLLLIHNSIHKEIQQNASSAKFRQIIRETALICIEQHQNTLAYQLLGLYLPNALNLIDYLVHNTPQLKSNAGVHYKAVSIPQMQIKEERKKIFDQEDKKNKKNIQQPNIVNSQEKKKIAPPRKNLVYENNFQPQIFEQQQKASQKNKESVKGLYTKQKKSIPPPPKVAKVQKQLLQSVISPIKANINPSASTLSAQYAPQTLNVARSYPSVANTPPPFNPPPPPSNTTVISQHNQPPPPPPPPPNPNFRSQTFTPVPTPPPSTSTRVPPSIQPIIAPTPNYPTKHAQITQLNNAHTSDVYKTKYQNSVPPPPQPPPLNAAKTKINPVNQPPQKKMSFQQEEQKPVIKKPPNIPAIKKFAPPPSFKQ